MINSKFFILSILVSFLFCFSDYKKKLSEYNIYKGNPHNLITTTNFLTYELITPLFSDYAYKHRAIYVPPDKRIIFDNEKVFEFPEGTIIIKTFYYPYDFSDYSKGISLKETRVMILNDEGWVGLPYVWNESETEAYLDITGGIKQAIWLDKAGNKNKIDYIIPNFNQCKGCHVNNNIFKPIGPSARQLNMVVDYKSESKNQLKKWFELGFLIQFLIL